MRYGKLLYPVLIGILLYTVNSKLMEALFEFYPPALQLTLGRGSWWLNKSPTVKILYVGVFAPFFEELVFRRIILAWFISRKKFTLGLAISSILFGLYHMAFGWGILKAVDMTLVGATFGLSYRRYQFRGSLLTHYANNIMSLANMLVF